VLLAKELKKNELKSNYLCVILNFNNLFFKNIFFFSINDTFAFRDIVPAHIVLERYFNEMYPKSTK
jgi:hypothetical protein